MSPYFWGALLFAFFCSAVGFAFAVMRADLQNGEDLEQESEE